MSFLADILENRLKSRDERRSLADLRAQAMDAESTRGFYNQIAIPDQLSVIAEIKFCTPTHGVLCTMKSVAEIATDYELAGARALSILTEPNVFKGKLEFLKEAKLATSLPILRKDFLWDERDIFESRVSDADAVLLIAKMLPQSKLKDLCALSSELGLGVLLELHDETDLKKAEEIKNVAWGLNHRDLDTLKINLDLSRTFFSMINDQGPKVAESGLQTREDIFLMQTRGANAVLIGTHLMKQESPGAALRSLLN